MHTNDSVKVVKQTRDWKNQLTTESLGTFDVWHEEQKTVASQTVKSSVPIEVEVSKGMFFIGENLDFSDTLAVFDGSTFTVSAFDIFKNRRGEFHHTEVFYK